MRTFLHPDNTNNGPEFKFENSFFPPPSIIITRYEEKKAIFFKASYFIVKKVGNDFRLIVACFKDESFPLQLINFFKFIFVGFFLRFKRVGVFRV